MSGRCLLPALLLAAALVGCEEQTASPTSIEPGPAFAKGGVSSQDGFVTTTPAFAYGLLPGIEIKALATVGDVMPGSGEILAAIPDGIGIWGGTRYMSMMLNHEISGSARVSQFTIDTKSAEIIDHRYVIDGSEGYSRLCSAEWVDARDGFPGGYFFTGEETDDGVQLAIDAQGRVTEMPWIGRYNHENQISVPGFPGHVVVLNFDDKGGSGRSLSELYMYVGRSSNDVLRGRGTLYVFRSTDPSIQTAGQIGVGQTITGTWTRIPDAEMLSSAELQDFVDAAGAFQFVRLEDGFYDKRPGRGASALFYDTGRSSVPNADGSPMDPWGSVYYLAMDPHDPAGAAELTLLARSDGPDLGWASPDNGDMNASGTVMLQEDPANGPWNRPVRIWQFQLSGDRSLSSATAVVEAVDPDCPGAGCSDVNDWETSGIVDASEYFGPGTWLFDVQAHGKDVPGQPEQPENGQLLWLKVPGS